MHGEHGDSVVETKHHSERAPIDVNCKVSLSSQAFRQGA